MNVSQVSRMRVVVPSAKIFSEPHSSAELDTQVLFGEELIVVKEESDHCLLVRTLLDQKQGYLQAYRHVLRPSIMTPEPTDRVRVPRALVYNKPSFKSTPVALLSMNAQISISEIRKFEGTAYASIATLGGEFGWIPADQIMPISEQVMDYVAVARQFIGVPYAWGFRDAVTGIDCSALIQQSLQLCGIPCERDSGPQSRTLGYEFTAEKEYKNLREGDFVFWTQGTGRHVAVMVNAQECIHATIAGPRRGVVIQPFTFVVRDKLQSGEGPPTVFRRL